VRIEEEKVPKRGDCVAGFGVVINIICIERNIGIGIARQRRFVGADTAASDDEPGDAYHGKCEDNFRPAHLCQPRGDRLN